MYRSIVQTFSRASPLPLPFVGGRPSILPLFLCNATGFSGNGCPSCFRGASRQQRPRFAYFVRLRGSLRRVFGKPPFPFLPKPDKFLRVIRPEKPQAQSRVLCQFTWFCSTRSHPRQGVSRVSGGRTDPAKSRLNHKSTFPRVIGACVCRRLVFGRYPSFNPASDPSQRHVITTNVVNTPPGFRIPRRPKRRHNPTEWFTGHAANGGRGYF